MKRERRGFTLIELLVVIAIIGILSSVVLASLNTARMKSRDTRRIADLKQLQLALALFYDSNNYYPLTLASLAPQYISTIPKDPSTNLNYVYSAQGASGCGLSANTVTSYHMGAILEDNTNQALNTDADSSGGTACTGSQNAEFQGLSTGAGACGTVSASPDQCYDVKP